MLGLVNEGMIVNYQIQTNIFKTEVLMLNLKINCKKKLEKISEGSYGQIYSIHLYRGRTVVSKRKLFGKFDTLKK